MDQVLFFNAMQEVHQKKKKHPSMRLKANPFSEGSSRLCALVAAFLFTSYDGKYSKKIEGVGQASS